MILLFNGKPIDTDVLPIIHGDCEATTREQALRNLGFPEDLLQDQLESEIEKIISYPISFFISSDL